MSTAYSDGNAFNRDGERAAGARDRGLPSTDRCSPNYMPFFARRAGRVAVERIIELVDDRIEDQIAADRTTRDAAVSDVPEFIAAQDLIVTQETVILNS